MDVNKIKGAETRLDIFQHITNIFLFLMKTSSYTLSPPLPPTTLPFSSFSALICRIETSRRFLNLISFSSCTNMPRLLTFHFFFHSNCISTYRQATFLHLQHKYMQMIYVCVLLTHIL